MATAGLNDVKKGMKILHNNDPWVITDADFIKPGKGQAFTRIFIRNLKNGRTSESTMKSSDSSLRPRYIEGLRSRELSLLARIAWCRIRLALRPTTTVGRWFHLHGIGRCNPDAGHHSRRATYRWPC